MTVRDCEKKGPVAGVTGPVMGALDAAAKACQIPRSWQNARYNEDLGTNPVWSSAAPRRELPRRPRLVDD